MLTSAVQSARRLWKAPFRLNYMGSVPKGDAWLNLSSPSVLFAAGEAGAWYDPSDYTTLFEDAAGTIPITSPLEKPVGLMLDKSKGLVLGPELAADWLNNSTGWTLDAGWSVSGGSLVGGAGANGTFASKPITTIAGRWYRFDINIASLSGTLQFTIRQDTSVGPVLAARDITNATGSFSLYFLATTATSVVRFGDYLTAVAVNNISVRELPGNHAYQSASSTSRPTLSARYNAYVGTETLSTQNVTTLAASYKLSFTGTGSITLSGTATGTYLAGTHTITCTAGTLTSTVAGAVTKADLRVTNDGVNLPVYQRVNTATDYDTVGFPLYLRFDGSDDWMVTNTITPGADKVQVFAGVRKLSDAATGVVCEINTSSTNGFGLLAPSTNGSNSYRFFSAGSLAGALAGTGVFAAAPTTNVLTGIGNISGDQVILRVNGTQVAIGTEDQGTGNYGNYPLYIGRRGGTTLPFNGQLYSLIARFGPTLTDAQITSTESWVNRKTGAY